MSYQAYEYIETFSSAAQGLITALSLAELLATGLGSAWLSYDSDAAADPPPPTEIDLEPDQAPQCSSVHDGYDSIYVYDDHCDVEYAALPPHNTHTLEAEHELSDHIHTMGLCLSCCPNSRRRDGRTQRVLDRAHHERGTRHGRQRIYFYDRNAPHYGFTNFSPHRVEYQGRTYPTSEHLFQAFKFLGHRPDISEHLRTVSDRPSVVFSEAHRFESEVRRDWSRVRISIMDEVLRLKFTQHPALQRELLDTGNAELIEDSDRDTFWGIGPNRSGRNELGKALERLRNKLRKQQQQKHGGGRRRWGR